MSLRWGRLGGAVVRLWPKFASQATFVLFIVSASGVSFGAEMQILVTDPELERAAAGGQLDVVRALVEDGVDVNAKSPNDTTALHAAAANDQVAVANFLLTHGADVNAKAGAYKWTPLHYAADRNSAAMVSLLLSHNADITVRNFWGVPAYRLATSEEVLTVFARAGAPIETTSLAAVDAAACEEVVRLGLWKKARSDDSESELPSYPQDPRDNWDFQDSPRVSQNIVEKLIHVKNYDYVLGVWSGEPKPVVVLDEELTPEYWGWVAQDMSRVKHRTGPVYLARQGTDGVASIACEFKNARHLGFRSHRVMTPLELLEVYAHKDSVTLSQAATKVPGLWGAQALLAASRKSPGEMSSLSSESHGSVLGDAIEAHREDILRFYLDHDVSPDLKRVKYELDPERNDLPAPGWFNDPLFTAVANSDSESMRLLLEHGANPDAVGSLDPNIIANSFNPAPVLAWAVMNARLTIVKTLLGYGSDPNLNSSVSDEVELIVRDTIAQSALADVEASGVHELFLRGADPNPFIKSLLQEYALHGFNRPSGDVWNLVVKYDEHPVETRRVREVFASSGSYLNNTARALLDDALQFRDAPDCTSNTPEIQLPICIPNSLKHADARVNLARRDRPRAQLEEQCNIHIAGKHTHGGWLAYVMSDQNRALCVLDGLAGNHH